MISLSSIIRGSERTESVLKYNYSRTFQDIRVKEEKKDLSKESSKEPSKDPLQEALEDSFQQTADIFDAANKRAETILTEAAEEARRLRTEAKEEAENIRSQARESGYQEGYDTGYGEGRRKAHEDHRAEMNRLTREFQAEMKAAVESVTKEKDKILEKYIDDLKKITLTIAEKVIQTSLKSSGEIIKRMIVSAAGKLKKTQWVKIYVSQTDASLMLQGDVGLLNELSHISGNIKIISMDHAEDGSCIIELPEEIIDVSVNTQLENIKGILNNARL